MKFLVLSDIHGNCVALEAVLNQVNNERYDKLLVLGDNVGDGPCPDRVLNILKNHNAIMIAGNREKLAANHFAGLKSTQTAMQWEFMRLSLAFLTDSQKSEIAALPEQLSLTDSDVSVKMVHGSPFSNREMLSVSKPERIVGCLEAINEDVLLCGHNHHQYVFFHRHKLLLNPGSVGLSQAGEPFRADYAILNLSGGQYSFELNHIHYNGDSILKEYKDRNLYEGIWAKLAYRDMSEGSTYINAFAHFVYELAQSKGECTNPISDSTWNEACSTFPWKLK